MNEADQTKRPGFLYCFRGSLGSFGFYREAVGLPLAKCIAYLAILLLISSVLIGIRYGLDARAEAKKFAAAYSEHMRRYPRDAEQPPFCYPIDYGGRRLALLFDTSGNTKTIDAEHSNALLFAGDRMVLRLDGMDRELPAKTSPLDQKTVAGAAQMVNVLAIPAISVGYFVYWTFTKTFHLFFFSLFSLIVNEIHHRRLKYQEIVRLGIFALTPPIVVTLAITLVGLNMPFLYLIYSFIYSVFLASAVIAVPPREDPSQDEIEDMDIF